MPLTIPYICQLCGEEMPREYEKMTCPCGGTYKPDGQLFSPQKSFEPYHDDRLNMRISSWSQAEKEGKKRGLGMTNDRKSFIKQCKQTLKNREDIIHSIYKKDGINYPKGKKCHFDDQKKCFIDQRTKEPITKSFITTPKTLRVSNKIKFKAAALILFTLLTTSAIAAEHPISGITYITLTVHGKQYDVPRYKPDFYTDDQIRTILQMLNGDKVSRQIFLQGKNERDLFIGDGSKIRWLKVTKTTETVEEL